MEFDEIVVKESPGLCRCCLSEGCYKDMGTEYAWMNENEVYADMLFECFDISISQLNDGPNGPNRLICEVCITRLRDACYFKKQVLESEKKFVDMVGRGEFKPKAMIVNQSNMKTEKEDDFEVTFEADEAEVEYLEDEMDYIDDEALKTEEPSTSVSDVTAEALPVRSKRGRPRKAPTKPVKKVKAEPKAKSSKALVKEPESSVRACGSQPKQSNKADLLQILTVITENSTIMPFRWYANKFMCFYCCCPFEDCCTLKQHTISEHAKANLKSVLSLVRSTKIKLDVSDITCKRCTKSLHNLEEFLTHASSIHDLKFNKNISKDFFSYKLSEKDNSCLECGQRFDFFGTLLKHVHKHHNKSNEFLCNFCGQGFIAKANVTSHIRNVHGQTECEKCQEIFPTQNALKVHFEKAHTVEKLKCPQCPEILGSRYLKQRHIVLVHDVKSDQHKCDVCSKVFPWRNQMLKHKAQVHLKKKSQACEICGLKVFNVQMLKSHMVCHDDSRPFQCEVCNKGFQRKKTLDLHLRIHTDDKRYACKECGKTFVQWTSWKNHQVEAHNSK